MFVTDKWKPDGSVPKEILQHFSLSDCGFHTNLQAEDEEQFCMLHAVIVLY